MERKVIAEELKGREGDERDDARMWRLRSYVDEVEMDEGREQVEGTESKMDADRLYGRKYGVGGS